MFSQGYITNMGGKLFSEGMTDSSGISLSFRSEQTDKYSTQPKHRLKLIAENHSELERHEGMRNERYQGQSRQSFTPFLPQIENKPRIAEKATNNSKCDFRLASLPKMQLSTQTAVPPTVGKYQHRRKVVPILNLPSPNPPRSPSPPPPMHFFLREQYVKERRQQSPGFTDADLARIFDHYSLSRYLASRGSRRSMSRNSPSRCKPTGFTSKYLFPSIPAMEKPVVNSVIKPPKLVWIPRLSSWIPENQKNIVRYLSWGNCATISVKQLPICCKTHDFFHNNLNWDVKNWIPTVCPRFCDHHHQNRLGKKASRRPHKLASLKRNKPLTIPKDPFTSKAQRNIKRPWLKSPQPLTQQKPTVHLVLPHQEDDLLPHMWMVDNSTMTEDSSSDIFSIATSIPMAPPSLSEDIQPPVHTKKKDTVTMVDKACDVMTPSAMYSPQDSHYTTESVNKDETAQECLSPISHKALLLSKDEEDFNKNDESILELVENDQTGCDPNLIDAASDDHTVEAEEELDNEEVLSNSDRTSTLSLIETESKHSGLSKDEPISISSSKQQTVMSPNEPNDMGQFFFVEELSSKTLSPAPPKKSKHRPKPPPPRLLTTAKDDEKTVNSQEKSSKISKPKQVVVVPLPSFSDRPVSSKSSKSNRTAISIHTPSSQRSSKRRGKAIRDKTIADELRRAQLAEERRNRAKQKFDKIKQSRQIAPTRKMTQIQSPVEDGFLDKLCILDPNKMKSYKRAFDSFDIDEDGCLDAEEVFLAVQKVLPSKSFKNSHVNHILRLLELVNYDMVSERIDFKLFTIISSLAQKILALDDFMKGLIDRFDLQSLDSKMWRARQFFNHFVDDRDKQTISMESLWIELKAGGIGPRHENQIRDSLKHLPHLDILDFMTYLPLFTLTHSHAISNPLNDERVK